jgi:hypothetical protein
VRGVAVQTILRYLERRFAYVPCPKYQVLAWRHRTDEHARLGGKQVRKVRTAGHALTDTMDVFRHYRGCAGAPVRGSWKVSGWRDVWSMTRPSTAWVVDKTSRKGDTMGGDSRRS